MLRAAALYSTASSVCTAAAAAGRSAFNRGSAGDGREEGKRGSAGDGREEGKRGSAGDGRGGSVTCTVVRSDGLEDTRKWPARVDLKRTRLPSATDRNATPGTVSHTGRCKQHPQHTREYHALGEERVQRGVGRGARRTEQSWRHQYRLCVTASSPTS